MEDYTFRNRHRKYENDTHELSKKTSYIPITNQRQSLDKPVKDPAREERYAQGTLYNFSSSEDATTYLEERGIERATYQGIRGMKTNHRGAIFGLYTKAGIQQGQGELCALEHYPKNHRETNKELQAYLPRGLSVIRPSGEVKEILITGSPISALSHKQLYGTEYTLYVSACGHLTKDIVRNFEEILLQAKERSIVVKLGFDRDEKSRGMAQQVAEIASKQGIICQMEFPKVGKDWNDMLLASKQQSKQLDPPKPATAFCRSL